MGAVLFRNTAHAARWISDALRKIDLEIEEEPFLLLGLHAVWESFRLAFHLNRQLRIQLRRARRDLDVYHEKMRAKAQYPYYTYLEVAKQRDWGLFTNSARMQRPATAALFETDTCEVYLVPEHREVDYLLKVSNTRSCEWDSILLYVKRIPGIRLATVIDTESLRSRNNLIF